MLRFKKKTPEQPETGSADNGRTATPACRDFALLLARSDLDEAKAQLAWKTLGDEMALIPEGEVLMVTTDVDSLTQIASQSAFDPAWVESFYMDRRAVTHGDFVEFVEADGYADENLWPAEILANLLQFVDSTEVPGAESSYSIRIRK